MAGMRSTITGKFSHKVITTPFNSSSELICKDLEIKDGKEHVTQNIKYFRNNDVATRAKDKQSGGKTSVFPSELEPCASLFRAAFPKRRLFAITFTAYIADLRVVEGCKKLV